MGKTHLFDKPAEIRLVFLSLFSQFHCLSRFD
jgi:hypothetical protein